MKTGGDHFADTGIPDTLQVHLWMLDLERHRSSKLSSELSLLDDSERDRILILRRERDRQRFCLTRAVLRNVLSSYCPEVQPARWRFNRNRHGKPAIATPVLSQKLSFNISHSGRWLIIAVSGNEDIGVDVEQTSRECNVQAIARRYFTAREYADLCDLAPDRRARRFYELWTLKEAYSKACGNALVPNLRKLEIAFPGGASIDAGLWISGNEKRAPDGWDLRLYALQDYQLAVAMRRDAGTDPFKLRVREIDDPLCAAAASELDLKLSYLLR